MDTQSSKDRLKRLILIGLFWLNMLVITVIWARNLRIHGALTMGVVMTALGHITGLLSAFTILCLLVLMSRMEILEDAFGMVQLTRVHRKVSYWAIGLLVAHTILLTVGYQLNLGLSFVEMFVKFATGFEDVLKADFGLVLFLLVTFSSIVIARKKLKYETWYFVHLLAYLGVLLGFQHQLSVGVDFVGHPWFVAYWYALYAVTVLMLLVFRVGWQLLVFRKHRFQLARVKRETHDTYSFILKGKNLQEFPYEPGQFAIWHVLAPGVWWQSHPFSISSVPNKRDIRFTAKMSGDYTTKLASVRPGTWVVVDGPHGKFVRRDHSGDKLLFIAGGVGITPLYAMLCDHAPAHKDIILLYANKTHQDIIFRKQIEVLQKNYGIKVHYFFSGEPSAKHKIIDEMALKTLVPDAAQRTVYLCGPPPMMDGVSKTLQTLGVAKKRIHTERFDY